MKHHPVILFSLFILWSACSDKKWPEPKVSDQQSIVAFYNVENLFDTIDDPRTNDEDFLPGSALNWDSEKYTDKINSISRVMEAMDFPELMGMAEVENAGVLEDLISSPSLAGQNYGFVHRETIDHRGIDCALLYKKDFLDVRKAYLLPIVIPDPDYTGRGVLFVEAKLPDSNFDLVIAVLHWPSRSGGLEKTEFRRWAAARQLREHIDRAYDPAEDNILIMGDFNDEPGNESLTKIFAAKSPGQYKNGSTHIYNLSYPAYQEGKGTYNFRGEWNMLDQILVSSPLLDCSDQYCIGNAQVYKASGLLFNHPEYGPSPNRTAGGPNYYGGYSDHLPVYAPMTVPAAQ